MNAKEKKAYKDTLDLFDNSCAICGSPNIAIHHILFGGLYGGRKTYLGNVIPLCPLHHNLVHTNKNKYIPILLKLLKEKGIDNENYKK